MKAVILAAGQGTRIRKFTGNIQNVSFELTGAPFSTINWKVFASQASVRSALLWDMRKNKSCATCGRDTATIRSKSRSLKTPRLR